MRSRSIILALAIPLALRAEAQTGQWSQPTTTGQWSQPGTTERWSEPAPAGRSPAKPKAPRPPPAARPAEGRPDAAAPGAAAPAAKAAFDERLVGRWSVRIPTAVGYRTDGSDLYQVITPGADLERLEVKADGRYCWASHCAEARPASPYFEMPGERWYEISDGKDVHVIAFVERRGIVKIVYTSGGLLAEGHPVRR